MSDPVAIALDTDEVAHEGLARAEAAIAEAVQTSGLPTPTDELVDAWFVETFHNLALPTELQNRLGEARDTLKARLRAKET